jgi:hypothetical protein
MGLLENIGNNIVESLTSSLRRFASFIFLLFALGVAYGALIITHNPAMLVWAIGIPVLLAVLAYFNTAFAVISFILLGLLLLVF